MPGRVINQLDPINVRINMTDNATRASVQEPSPALPNGLPAKPPPLRDTTQDAPHAAHSSNSAAATNGPSSGGPGQALLPKDLRLAMHQIPLELPPLLHVTDGYQPLSKLFERAAQECFNSLNDTIANAQDPPRSRMVNGNSGGADHDSSSAAKRLRWLHFANSNRERFIKLLVLLQWSRQARQDIGQLVDVVSWMRQLLDSYDDLEDALGLLKREMADVKIPSPDIDTALEVLTTGQSSQMPDLSYLPRPPSSARSILDTLQNLNTLLHIRLNVYEELPRHLRLFRIASGRVTFIIPDEFELDLSIFDEDPSTHFYFLDFRFLFSPCSDLPDGRLRAELERRANTVLASDGLAGCYDLFHDFILTYKISILRRQAVELARRAWTGSIRVERVHRSLIIQYWIDSNQKKSWVEIGIKSGSRRDGSQSWRGDEQSRLFVKWVRAGKEVPDPDFIPLNVQDLDVEAILDSVIRQHIRHLIASARDKVGEAFLLDLAPPVELTLSNEDEADSCLVIPLYFTGVSTLRVEPISGKCSLSPKTPSSTRCENSLNKLQNPEEELGAKLLAWRAYDGSATFKDSVIRYGWEVVKSIQLEGSTRKKYFGESSIGLCFVKHWSNPSWVIAASPNAELSFSLWILNVEEPSQTLWRSEDFNVRHAFKIDRDSKKLSADFFSSLDRHCIATISFQLTRKRLAELHVPFTTTTPEKVLPPLAFPSLSLDVSRVVQPSAISSHLTIHHYGREKVLTGHQNPDYSAPEVVHVAKGTLAGSQESKSMLVPIQSRDIGFTKDGEFRIFDRSPAFSGQVVDNILRTLRHIVQLQGCLETLKNQCFRISSVTLNKLTFSYAYGSRKLQARLSWSETGAISLELAPRDNPHNRLRPVFQNLLQHASTSSTQPNAATSALTQLTRSLLLTLNLVGVFDTIESRGGTIVNTDGLGKYSMIYDRPRCILNITLREDQERSWWYIEQDHRSPRSNAKLQAELKSFLTERGDGYIALNKGAAAEPNMVDKVLERLDTRIRACADGEERKTKKTKTADNSTNPPESEEATAASGKKEKAPGKSQAKKQQPQAKPVNGTTNGSGQNLGNGNGTNNRGVNGGGNGVKPEVVVLD